MKNKVLKLLVITLILFGMLPHMALADETTYTVTVTARNGNRTLQNVTIVVEQNEETITQGTTNNRGVATFNLTNGTYTATIDYVSGDYSYYGTTEITVNGKDTTATVNVDSEYTIEAAKERYDNVEYFDHIDIRVNGTFSTGTDGNVTTYPIKIQNVELLVTNGETILVNDTFTNNNETYEWRKTRLEIPHTAVVSLVFDIVLEGETVRENYVTSFSGEEDFIQAIINCDNNQGLDFIIDSSEIIAAAFYNVSYQWTGLPEGLATLPSTTTGYSSNDSHTIDTQFKIGDVIIDEINKVQYTFSGWTEWSNAEDNHATKNNIGSSTSLTITNDTIIYGVWESSPIIPTSNHIIIKKTFSGNDGRLPVNLLFKVTNTNTTEQFIMELPLKSFKYDEKTGLYTYDLVINEAGTYTIEELNYTIPGYTFDTTNSTNVIQNITTNLMNEVTVSFGNVYTKNPGVDYHSSVFIVEKLDASDRNVLSGAVFTLTNQSGEIVAEATTNSSGYATFMNLAAGIYTLKETSAPNGYHLNKTEYTVTITEVSSKEVYSETQNAYIMQHEYNVTITPNENYNSNGNKLIVFNERITGSITISKTFGETSKYNKENYPSNSVIKVVVTGPNNYSETITLDATNNWTKTLENLELGTYTVEELTASAQIPGYTLNTTYTINNIITNTVKLNLTETNYQEEIIITNTYTKIPEDIHNNASFSVKKVDEFGNVLAGATFGLYNSDNELILTQTTDETGIVTFTGFNKEAVYTLKEISAPTYYNKVNTEWTINVTLENGKPSTETGDNVYNWNITINNTDYAEKELTVVNKLMTGSITITKEVQILSNNEIIEKPSEVKDVKYSFTVIIGEETYIVELIDGESKTFENIPYGTKYQVFENIPEDATWTHTAPTNASGTITSEETSINMVNTYNINIGNGEDDNNDNNDNDNKVPQTGYDKTVYLYSLITLLGMIGLILTRKKYNKTY